MRRAFMINLKVSMSKDKINKYMPSAINICGLKDPIYDKVIVSRRYGVNYIPRQQTFSTQRKPYNQIVYGMRGPSARPFKSYYPIRIPIPLISSSSSS